MQILLFIGSMQGHTLNVSLRIVSVGCSASLKCNLNIYTDWLHFSNQRIFMPYILREKSQSKDAEKRLLNADGCIKDEVKPNKILSTKE